MNYPHSEFSANHYSDDKPRRRRKAAGKDKRLNADLSKFEQLRSRSRRQDYDDFGDSDDGLEDIVDIDDDNDDLDDDDLEDYGIDDDDLDDDDYYGTDDE